MFVCCGGLCDELITHPEEFYREWCIVVCDPEYLMNEAIALNGLQCHKEKKKIVWAANY